MKLVPLVMKNMHQSHKSRNAKTSMLFTIALAYLVFSGSSLLLIGNLIVGTVKNFLGSDIFINSWFSDNYLPEQSLRDFLDEEKAKNNSMVSDYAFVGVEFDYFCNDILDLSASPYVVSGGYFPNNFINLFPIDERYLQSSLTEYYIPKYGQSGVNFPSVDGKDDFVWSLYHDAGKTDFGGDLDKFDILSYNLTDNKDVIYDDPDPTTQIGIIMPEGIKSVLSISGGDTIELELDTTTNDDNERSMIQNYRLLVRGLPQKFPGFFFMSYKQVQFFLQGVISLPDAQIIAELLSQASDDIAKNYEEYKNSKAGSTTSYFYPKDRLLVDVKDGVSSEDREVLV